MQRGRVARSLGVILGMLALAMPPASRAADCGGDGEVAILISPRTPVAGGRLQVLAASDTGPLDDLIVLDADAQPVAGTVERLGGPPWSAVAAVEPPDSGSYRVHAVRNGRMAACETITVGAAGTRAKPEDVAARAPGGWDRGSEALYSAWVEHLFDAPAAEPLSFDALQRVLTDPGRNLLYDHFGLGEDEGNGALGAPPDCADLPYVLRAYFAWKTGLPVGFRRCGRGSASGPPTCEAMKVAAPADGSDVRGWYGRVVRQVMDAVHSGSARTGLTDSATDFYPVAVTRAALRPGTIYADPYGHTLVVVKWVPQTAERGGMLLAVDAQPDNSVARKRFWEGTFLFADVPSAGPGFKAFRPLVRNDHGGFAALSNAELADDPRFVPYSAEQAMLTPDEFYARVGHIMNPAGLRPQQAYDEMLDALVEQLTTRVDSVRRGEDYVRAHPRETVAMPHGARIFETIGPWEDFATPSRDLRLQIAMRVLLDLPEHVIRHPELYVLDGLPPSAARTMVEERHAGAISERAITYTRSDGSPWRLTVADLLARRSALEMAYNPNDCVEIRWGAEPGTDEVATCLRHAPAEQRARMQSYRPWFREGRRPGR